MGKRGKNQFGFEDCSPLFPCEVCIAFGRLDSSVMKCYPKGMNPNIRPYKQGKDVTEILDELEKNES